MNVNEDDDMASVNIPAGVPDRVSEEVSSALAVSHESVINTNLMQTENIMSCSLHVMLILYMFHKSKIKIYVYRNSVAQF